MDAQLTFPDSICLYAAIATLFSWPRSMTRSAAAMVPRRCAMMTRVRLSCRMASLTRLSRATSSGSWPHRGTGSWAMSKAI